MSSIGRLMTEGLELHLDMSHADAVKRSIELLDEVGIRPDATQTMTFHRGRMSGPRRQT